MATSIVTRPEVSAQPAQTIPWRPLAVFSALFLVLYAPVVYKMAKEWFELEEMGHGIFVPFVAGYIAWQKRDEILSQPVKPNLWGIPIMIWSFIQLLLGHLGADFFVERTALIGSLIGIVLTCCGTAVLRKVLLPIAILLFMIRLPLFVYSQITFPLQLFASQVAETALTLLGIPVLRDGNVLELSNQRLSVVEACSGIRSLISLTFLAITYGYFFEKRTWVRWVLVLIAVPIAVATNAFRVAATGVLTEYSPELAQGLYHTMEGWLIFMLALVLLVTAHFFLTKIRGVADVRHS